MAGTVPESLLKKRQRDEQWATQKASAAADAKAKSKANRKVIFKRAESYVKEYRSQVRADARPSALPTFACTVPGQVAIGEDSVPAQWVPGTQLEPRRAWLARCPSAAHQQQPAAVVSRDRQGLRQQSGARAAH